MPDQYAVIGNPVEHSLSPQIHAEFARVTGQDLAYGRILAPRDGFRDAVLAVPAAGAVNTLSFQGEKIEGHNTDGIGLVRDLTRNLRIAVRAKRVLLMGAGGPAYGVMEWLLRGQAGTVAGANRTRG